MTLKEVANGNVNLNLYLMLLLTLDKGLFLGKDNKNIKRSQENRENPDKAFFLDKQLVRKVCSPLKLDRSLPYL